MTKQELERLKNWANRHSSYVGFSAVAILALIIGLFALYDARWDGGVKRGLNADECQFDILSDRYLERTENCENKQVPHTLGTIAGATFVGAGGLALLSLPISSTLLFLRRRTFEGDQRLTRRKKRKLDRRRRMEIAVRAYEEGKL